jgi:hypothetical protein
MDKKQSHTSTATLSLAAMSVTDQMRSGLAKMLQPLPPAIMTLLGIPPGSNLRF